jgi:primosomal protein N' (replication factor Y)
MADTLVCRVCIPNTFGFLYDYHMPSVPPPLGCRVLVPFRNGQKTGVVWAHGVVDNPQYVIRDIFKVDETVIVDESLRKLFLWLSEYYHAPLSEVLALALPRFIKEIERPIHLETERAYQLLEHAPIPARSKKLIQLAEFLKKSDAPFDLSALKQAGFSKALLNQALGQQVVALVELVPSAKITKNLSLNPQQLEVFHQIQDSAFQVYLLQGVTGSGKTEVYIELMKSVIARGQQILMLVPEIGLTTALFERMKERLGPSVLMMHSDLTDKQRFQNWLKAYHGQVDLILGTRSAVFANFPNLGLIIIDEEHDGSFKQLDGIRYSAKDTAIVKAKMLNIPIVLGTATPSLESYQNVLNHKYQLLTLNQKALNQHPIAYQIVDLRRQKTEHGLASTTLNLIDKHLHQGEQVLVFINRRGYAPLIYCHDCGWRKKCHNCDANMTWHKKNNCLMCHHCGSKTLISKQCESCFSTQLQPMGVGTERLLTFLSQRFDAFSCMRFDRDVVQNRHDLEHSLQEIYDNKVQLIIGTQMLTKGHHFPNLGLVVIVDGDSGFYQSDFRALERLGQLFTQVSGRAGRAEIPGEVCIQTHLPEHPLLMKLLHEGYMPFMKDLLQQRQEAFLPPFSHMALIRAQGKNSKSIECFLKEIKSHALSDSLQVFGPAPAPMEKKAGLVRWQLILKAKQRPHLHQALKQIDISPPKGVRSFIEVDPYDWSA